MIPVIVILLACGYATCAEMHRPVYNIEHASYYFDDFVTTYNKQYGSENEKQKRFEIFSETLKNINKMNAAGGAVHGINRFSDLTMDEFLGQYTGLRADKYNQSSCTELTHNHKVKAAPAKFDWRDKNVVTPVKNQQQCGSCYAHSAIGNIESLYAMKYNGQMLDLSEQQLVDCSTKNARCSGGYMSTCMLDIIEAGGIESEADYPYIAAENKNCKFQKSLAKVQLSGCTVFDQQDEEKFKDDLFTNGPISIAVAAQALLSYNGGIITECPGEINHAVLLIGYGTENGVDFWTIKNSWGSGWGEQGFFRVARGRNMCSMMNQLMCSAVVA